MFVLHAVKDTQPIPESPNMLVSTKNENDPKLTFVFMMFAIANTADARLKLSSTTRHTPASSSLPKIPSYTGAVFASPTCQRTRTTSTWHVISILTRNGSVDSVIRNFLMKAVLTFTVS
jgi:hypothetical protein